ncbi:bifunctional tRNA (5-methylaminomethyl-2-thiouridine)(34)-methyltransferase MnmD/FAD-dependent 5-carboxymethylaminomethyl-2-thiouridine(34) oxidoreductase MnmC [Alteromonas sp. ASW11-36]|uniref:tRNA 5-methylaminomethyl-2-thiouridine biosynthesis bifunctional protein MnmC n=1 Tax=Alteromonas arenosi TaxID=3055817 RepID=A0ABT7SVU8_9ALTE|nr:bifunctional tRNA (5-methylaminomethyl-2-thiouridine)(34)-methyltransferase MnmD/FAD-dependent 5-carboxymethylaminomethyl-2-thiouridine(34) oxidoreductase MnmC [Alteromonas sp. ASW11-36]MDM7860322.1 bifunctional tRNA (5-methylaminomethyl-2-thiouridine)(34)-methyltransferase MnmD/FAD-dependent 5-carboxymethylaminomethyl-2-thiouridine(34) oxidoreductase MnmC [Alteromonas sp. ASW11-36]
MPQTYAKVQFNENGTPIAEHFDDVYFSKDDAEAETRYVFIANNQLPERWKNWRTRRFTIGETGFGTGLNFLLAAQTLIEVLQQSPQTKLRHLHFVSTEKYPLPQLDWQRALQPFRHLALCEALGTIKVYPVAGCQRFTFSYQELHFTLDLWIGDVLEQLPNIQYEQAGPIDAWFLDGFAPSKNPGMWQAELFAEMARLSHSTTTFATFTAAGFVKRGLQTAGFNVEKRPGFGRKRDMLAGNFSTCDTVPPMRDTPYLKRAAVKCSHSNTPNIAVIGGGIAAACMAYALTKRGSEVTMITKGNALADAASGNPQAAVYPQLNAQPSYLSQIQVASFAYCKQFYIHLAQSGANFQHDWCGVLQIGFSETVQQRQEKLIDNEIWPNSLIYSVSQQEVADITGVDLPYAGLFIPDAGWLVPAEVVQAVMDAARQLAMVNVSFNTRVIGIEHTDSDSVNVHVRTETGDEKVQQFDAVVFATGHSSQQLPLLDQLPMSLTRGQVESINSQTPLPALRTVLCHKGYLTPALNGRHALGSTYVKQDTNSDYRETESIQNLATQAKSMAACDWAQTLRHDGVGRAAVRCSTPDHLPLVGAIPNCKQQQQQYNGFMEKRRRELPQEPAVYANTFVLTGLGSRGFTTAPLMAEVLASQMFAEAAPLSHELLATINPNRFLLRSLKRGEG